MRMTISFNGKVGNVNIESFDSIIISPKYKHTQGEHEVIVMNKDRTRSADFIAYGRLGAMELADSIFNAVAKKKLGLV